MKPLVIDEQLATGVVRFELFGDADLCRKFLHHGRRQLGSMRVMYGVNQRISDGEGGGFYHQWGKARHDGVLAEIQTITNDGQDVVRIYALGPPPTPAPEPLPEHLEVDQYAVCGHGSFERDGFASGNLHAWVWKPGAASVTEIPGPGGARSWWANAISGDGRVVVGGWIDEGSGIQRAYRWSHATGPEDLGTLYAGDDAPVAEATGVNADGTVVVGSGPHSNDSQHCVCWVWREGAMTELTDSGCNHSGGSAQRVSVSPNGKFIFGTALRSMPSHYDSAGGTGGGSGDLRWELRYADLPRGALWSGRDGSYTGPMMVPEPGTIDTVTTDATGAGLGLNQVDIPYSILPGEVSNNGTVCGVAPYAARCTLDGAIDFITDPGASTVGEIIINTIQHWGPDGEATSAVAITADGAKVAGTLSEGSFTWTRERLRRGYPSETGLVAGMSYDGTRYCGNSALRPSNDGSFSDPLYWDGVREQVIPPMSGAFQTTATDVASVNLRIPPLPPSPLPQGIGLAGPGT